MKKNLILHVGRHKTASSSVQRFFYNHRNELKDCGILYPETGLHGEQHLRIPNCFNQMYGLPDEFNLDASYYLNGILAEIRKDTDVVLLSSESYFDLASSGKLPRLLESMESLFSVSIVAVMRDPHDSIVSALKHQIRVGAAPSVGDQLSSVRDYYQDYVTRISVGDVYLQSLDCCKRVDFKKSFMVREFVNSLQDRHFRGDWSRVKLIYNKMYHLNDIRVNVDPFDDQDYEIALRVIVLLNIDCGFNLTGSDLISLFNNIRNISKNKKQDLRLVGFSEFLRKSALLTRLHILKLYKKTDITFYRGLIHSISLIPTGPEGDSQDSRIG